MWLEAAQLHMDLLGAEKQFNILISLESDGLFLVTGERGASLDPYNIEVDNGVVHFTADVVLLDEDGDGVGNSVDE